VNRRWRNLLPRRGTFAPVPLVGLAPSPPVRAPGLIEPSGPRPRVAARVRRGQFLSVPPAPVAASPPPWLQSAVEPAGSRPRWARVRKGSFLAAPLPQQVPPPMVGPVGNRSRLVMLRRGAVWMVPPPQVAVTAPPIVPGAVDQAGSRPRWLRVRRGAFLTVPLVGLAPSPPIVPPPARHLLRTAIPARGRFRPVPPTTPLVLSTRRSQGKLPPTRRSARFSVIPAQVPSLAVWVPTPTRRSPLRSLLFRRGRLQLIPRTISPAIPPIPPKLHRTRRPVAFTRRGSSFGVPLVGAAAPATGFVCQDFAAAVAADLYAAAATTDSYTSLAAADSYSATSTPDTYSGVATNCGR
jgi:hypothetical protein